MKFRKGNQFVVLKKFTVELTCPKKSVFKGGEVMILMKHEGFTYSSLINQDFDDGYLVNKGRGSQFGFVLYGVEKDRIEKLIKSGYIKKLRGVLSKQRITTIDKQMKIDYWETYRKVNA